MFLQTFQRFSGLKNHAKLYIEHMDASPSIRSSYRPAQGVQYQHPKPAAHEALQKLVNNCLQGLRIYQPFQGEKALAPLSRGVFYALVHTNPVESGFLVFSPNHTPIYMHESLRRSLIVRMRLSSTMHAQTAIFAVSLDKSDGFLWLEDVLAWNSQSIHASKTFTERRALLKQFLDHHWMPDARCAGGLTIRIANYKPLEYVKEIADELSWSAIDLCPELPDRRRFRIKAAGGVASSLVGELRAVSGLPDVYELWSAEDFCVGRAAVQELALSRTIRERIAKEKVYVEVAWNQEFERFRIVTLVSSATPRSPTARFGQAKPVVKASEEVTE
jgi:hypothetical protein